MNKYVDNIYKVLLDVVLIRFFFFQAEDGIRDYKVTGVQTCALPISSFARVSSSSTTGSIGNVGSCMRISSAALISGMNFEIGRASCRERGVDLGGRRIIKKKKK